MNLAIVTFTPTGSGLPTFTVEAGVYVASGDASGVEVIDRMAALPTGLVYDPDGVDDAPTVPGSVWWELEFRGANPYAHTQYQNLLALKGKHGELRAKIPAGVGSIYYYRADARLTELSSTWEPPYRQAVANALSARVVFRLKEKWSAE